MINPWISIIHYRPSWQFSQRWCWHPQNPQCPAASTSPAASRRHRVNTELPPPSMELHHPDRPSPVHRPPTEHPPTKRRPRQWSSPTLSTGRPAQPLSTAHRPPALSMELLLHPARSMGRHRSNTLLPARNTELLPPRVRSMVHLVPCMEPLVEDMLVVGRDMMISR